MEEKRECNEKIYVPVTDTMQACFEYGKLGFPCDFFHDNISKFFENNINWHWQEEIEISFIKKGCVEVQCLEEKYIIQENEGYVVFPGFLHRIAKWKDEEGIYDTLYVKPDFLYGKQTSIIYQKYFLPILEKAKKGVFLFSGNSEWGKDIIDKVKETIFLLEEQPPFYEINVEQNLLLVWKIIVENFYNTVDSSRTQITKSTEHRIRNMLSFIHSNYEKTISLHDIANAGVVGESECCRIFKRYIHKTPIEYLMEYRIEQSVALIIKTDFTVTEIGLLVGFNSTNHFINIFKRVLGYTPYRYKKHVQENGG